MDLEAVVDIEWWVLNGLLILLIVVLFGWTVYEKRRVSQEDGFQPVSQS